MSSAHDPQQIAEAFRAFIPEQRFRDFVRVLNTRARGKGRLLAWQEFLWATFIAGRPDAPTAFDDIATALCICPVHLTRMTLQAVPVEHGYWQFPPSLIEARDTLFPFAHYMVYGPDHGERLASATVPVCQDCRSALDQWNASHRIPFGMPRFATDPEWEGDYLVVSDIIQTPRGLALLGAAPEADDPWPAVGQTVELLSPNGDSCIVTVQEIDRSVTRSCFSDGSAQRALLMGPELVRERAVSGTRVRAVRSRPKG